MSFHAVSHRIADDVADFFEALVLEIIISATVLFPGIHNACASKHREVFRNVGLGGTRVLDDVAHEALVFSDDALKNAKSRWVGERFEYPAHRFEDFILLNGHISLYSYMLM